MTLPYDRFVWYLFALGMSQDQVIQLLENDKMVVPTEAELAEIKFKMDLPEAFCFYDTKDKHGHDWITTRKLVSVFRGLPVSVRAFDLLRSPFRDVIEVLVAGGWRHSSVAEFLKENELATDVTAADIEFFAHMFWSLSAVPLAHLVTSVLPRHPLGDTLVRVLEKGPDEARTAAEIVVNRLRRHWEFFPKERIEVAGGDQYTQS